MKPKSMALAVRFALAQLRKDYQDRQARLQCCSGCRAGLI